MARREISVTVRLFQNMGETKIVDPPHGLILLFGILLNMKRPLFFFFFMNILFVYATLYLQSYWHWHLAPHVPSDTIHMSHLIPFFSNTLSLYKRLRSL